jgi:hypothetical protein
MSDYLTSELMAWHLKCLAEYDEEIKGKALTPEEEEAEEMALFQWLVDSGNILEQSAKKNLSDFVKKKRAKHYIEKPDFFQTYWGQLISHPKVDDPKSKQGKDFRRRFRLPFPVFCDLVKLCKKFNVFNRVYESCILVEAKVLACLRILGRNTIADDVNELTGNLIGESTAHTIFRQFCNGVSKYIYPRFVKEPLSDPETLAQIMAVYSRLGLHGCVGSMDCTHIKWSMCPAKLRFYCTGKEGFPTLVFLQVVIVDHYRRVLYVSRYFCGASNDITICNNDPYCLKILNGHLEDVPFVLYNSFGDIVTCKGGYLVVDGGFPDSITLMDPDKKRMSRENVLWSEWVESVRKDVECFFGVLKSRFRFFKNGVVYHDPALIEKAFKTASCLHNMILSFDQKATGTDKVRSLFSILHLTSYILHFIQFVCYRNGRM